MFRLVSFTLIVAVGSACAPVYVSPATMPNLSSEAGDVTAAAFAGVNGIDAVVMFAPVENVVFGAQGSFDEGNNPRHRFSQGFVGYHRRVANDGALSFGVQGGVGQGDSRGTEVELGGSDVAGAVGGTYLRSYVQGHFGLATEYLDAALFLRGAYVTYDYDEHPLGRERGENVLFEPMLHFAVGVEALKVALQGGLVLGNAEPGVLDVVPIHLSLGLQGRFNLWGE